MRVILRQDIATLGKAGQAIEVKAGYGRNYLIARNLAVAATKGNLRAIDEIKAQNDLKEKKKRAESIKFKEQLEKLSITSEVLVGEEDKVFGSVTSQHIVDLIEVEGHKIDKRNVMLDDSIKSLGVYTVPIKIDKDITANVKLWVIRKA
jgi:large subunit ribosomal protein L9